MQKEQWNGSNHEAVQVVENIELGDIVAIVARYCVGLIRKKGSLTFGNS